MKQCTACNNVKELTEFSAQKTKPGKLYAWCDLCRKSQPVPNKRHPGFAKEMSELRNKAVQLRAFSPDEAKTLVTRYKSGEKIADLALETGRSETTIYKTINRAGGSTKKVLKPNPFA